MVHTTSEKKFRLYYITVKGSDGDLYTVYFTNIKKANKYISEYFEKSKVGIQIDSIDLSIIDNKICLVKPDSFNWLRGNKQKDKYEKLEMV